MYKHLSIEQRVLIEDRLNKGTSIRSIAKELAVSPSTILREITRHTQNIKAMQNICAHRRDCVRHYLCGNTKCRRMCAKCVSHKCCTYCPDYEKKLCDRLLVAPYLCNGCRKINQCYMEKHLYKANLAEKDYQTTLVSARTGFDVTDSEMKEIDVLASPLIKNGLSPYHVKETLGERLPVSESTLRRMIDKCELDARNIDLRDKVKRNPRGSSKNKARNKLLHVSKIGRFYNDYLKYIEENDVFTVEMDCVEGKKSEPEVLLTLTWKELSFQIALILEEQSAECVVSAIDKLEEILGPQLFMDVFPLILTDNGAEFTDISGMETSRIGHKRTRIFFCDANRSEQKGTCENHHKMIRYCIPKGTSLQLYNQLDISLMMNHINSYKRKALFGKSAFDMAKGSLPEDFFALLGLEEVAPDKIILTPKLFLHSKCNG